LKDPRYGTAIDSFVATSMVILAFDTSGGYLNPVLATALKFGCRGHTPVEHFIVYWLGEIFYLVNLNCVIPNIQSKENYLLAINTPQLTFKDIGIEYQDRVVFEK
jgi:hypothetical protein